MNTRYIFVMLLALVALSGQAKKQKQLVILHTNDTHSTIFPVNSQLPDTMKAGRGGFIRRIEMLRQERQKHPDLLYFDSGDFCQGSAYYTMFKGDVEVGLMNEMGIDASTIGNHEFDFGLENMARIFKMCNFPILCTNYDFTGTVMEGVCKPWIILKRNGVKIGVFAVCPKLQGLVSNKNCEGVKYLDPAKVALETATMLKLEKKCDVVICISHLGWENYRAEDDLYMIKNSRNIDLVLGGHTHTYLPTLEYVNNLDGKPVPVDQNGKHAIFVGKIVMNLE
ncbi:MAG: metallophosphatase [Prevotella sp.]|nr:metallophosphatase [Prevotella sp.]